MSLILLCSSLMELFKLQALASYVFLALNKPLPLLPLSIAFLIAVGIGRLLKRRSGLKVYLHAAVHSILFLAAVYLTFAWFRGGIFNTLIEISVLATTFSVFWLRAAWLESIELDHAFLAERFDEGLASFLGPMLIAAIVRLENPLPGQLFVPFLAFSVLSLGFSRQGASRDLSLGGFSKKRRRTLFAELAAALAIAGLGLSRLVPLLAKPAKSAAESLQQVGIGLLDYIARFLTWLFRPRQARRMDIGESSSRIMGEPPPPMADETSVFGTIVVWVVLVLAAAFSIALLGYLFFLLFTWLGKKVDARKVERNASGFVKWPKRSAQGKFLSNSAAMRAYRILLRRGKAVRMQRKSSETPREYATRLAMAFPKSTKGAEILVLCVEREVYGNLLPSEKESIILRDIASRIRMWSFSVEKIGRILRKLGDKRHFRHSKPGSILDQ